MSAFSRLTPLAASLPSTVPFVGPEAIERNRGLKVEARIGANESGFGPAPSVLLAMRDAAAETWMYSDPENYELKEALAIHHGVARGNIAIGSGVDGDRAADRRAGHACRNIPGRLSHLQLPCERFRRETRDHALC